MCARALVRAGHRVTVLEQADGVGGRVRTTVRDGFRIDHGFQVLFTAYPVLAAQLDLGALALRDFLPAARIGGTGRAPSLMGDAIAQPALLLPTLAAPQLPLVDKYRLWRLRAFAQRLAFDDCFDARFDRLTTRDFLRARGFSAATIDCFFAPFYGGILLDRALDTAASVLLYTFRMLGAGRTVVPSAGMGAISEQLARSLPGDSVRCGVRVRAVRTDAGAARGVTLDDGTTLDADAVVLAVDPWQLGALAESAGLALPSLEEARGCTTIWYASRRPPRSAMRHRSMMPRSTHACVPTSRCSAGAYCPTTRRRSRPGVCRAASIRSRPVPPRVALPRAPRSRGSCWPARRCTPVRSRAPRVVASRRRRRSRRHSERAHSRRSPPVAPSVPC
ncbi:MAG: FAD-dependent oxidoreductase [Gemmatimonadaceae bacterium]|nr:FAD-dependent oxidoreductase [Gemmatimonadaceae bacterium]